MYASLSNEMQKIPEMNQNGPDMTIKMDRNGQNLKSRVNRITDRFNKESFISFLVLSKIDKVIRVMIGKIMRF